MFPVCGSGNGPQFVGDHEQFISFVIAIRATRERNPSYRYGDTHETDAIQEYLVNAYGCDPRGDPAEKKNRAENQICIQPAPADLLREAQEVQATGICGRVVSVRHLESPCLRVLWTCAGVARQLITEKCLATTLAETFEADLSHT